MSATRDLDAKPADQSANDKSVKLSLMNVSFFKPVADAMSKPMERTLTLGKETLTKRLTKKGDKYLLYFKLNDHTQLINEGARMIAEKIREMKIENPYFVTPEASTLSLAYALRDKYGMDGLNVYKTRQDDDEDPVSVSYYTVTDPGKLKTLFLCKNKIAEAAANKTIILIDSVCTTGGTMIALHDLLVKAGVKPESIGCAMNLFDEGGVKDELVTTNNYKLPLVTFGHLHLYDEKGDVLDGGVARLGK